MGEVSLRTLNQETAKVLTRVKGGEEIVITERGQAIARIVPSVAGPLQALINSGRVQPATLHGSALRPSGSIDHEIEAGELLERMRSEERF